MNIIHEMIQSSNENKKLSWIHVINMNSKVFTVYTHTCT